MAKSIYRINNDIYDADTGVKVASPEALRADYSGAREVKAPIKRDGAGFGVGYASGPASGVDSWKNYENLKGAAQKLLEMQTNKNADLTSASSYWNEIKKDGTPFGGARDSVATTVGTLEDKDFRLMSPADQASVRQSRESAAEAHLQGISQERKYRESVGGTALQNVSDIYTKQQQAIRDERAAADKNLQTKTDLGIPLTDADYKGMGIDANEGRVGASLSFRNNNSGNLKFSNWQTQYGAIKDPNSSFAKFPDEQSARNAYKALLTSPTGIYKGLDLNSAMLKWSSDFAGDTRAYNYDKLVNLGAPAIGKPFSRFTDSEWNQFFEAQKKAEGWNPGTELPSVKKNTYTSTQLNTLAKDTGKTIAELKAMSTDELNTLSNEIVNDPYIKLANNTDGVIIQTKHGISAKDISDILKLKAMGGTALNDYKNELIKAGVDTAALDAVVKLNEPKETSTGTTRALLGVPVK